MAPKVASAPRGCGTQPVAAYPVQSLPQANQNPEPTPFKQSAFLIVNFKKVCELLFLPMLDLSPEDQDRIIEMAREDRTPFEAIKFQFGLPESKVIELMRSKLKRGSFNLWRKRVNQGISQKHLKKRNTEINRFKSAAQRQISNNKISKR